MGSGGDPLSGAGLNVAEVINLRTARKAKARTSAAQQAAANRAKHGRTKAERARQQAEAARLAHQLDGAKLEPDG